MGVMGEPLPCTIRLATIADEDAINTMLAASYPNLLAASYERELLDRVLPLISRASPALLRSGTYYVATTSDGRLVGCGGWTREKPGSSAVTAGEGHVRHFATHKDAVRRGVAARILARCVSDASALGLGKLQVQSTLNAERFYRAAGFHSIATTVLALRPDLQFPIVVMERELP